jgi:hypothetical protein
MGVVVRFASSLNFWRGCLELWSFGGVSQIGS